MSVGRSQRKDPTVALHLWRALSLREELRLGLAKLHNVPVMGDMYAIVTTTVAVKIQAMVQHVLSVDTTQISLGRRATSAGNVPNLVSAVDHQGTVVNLPKDLLASITYAISPRKKYLKIVLEFPKNKSLRRVDLTVNSVIIEKLKNDVFFLIMNNNISCDLHCEHRCTYTRKEITR